MFPLGLAMTGRGDCAACQPGVRLVFGVEKIDC
jgi:hypothetical protein